MNDPPVDINNLRDKLRDLDERFQREMLARGFDPLQADNTALPSALATLYIEREKIREQLEEHSSKESESENRD